MDVTGMYLNVGGYSLEPGVATAAAVFLVTWLALRIFRNSVLAHMKKVADKTKTDFDDLLIRLIEDIPWSFYVLAGLFVALQFAAIPVFLSNAMGYAVIVTAVYYGIRSSHILIEYFRDKVIKKRLAVDENEDVSMIKLLADIIKLSMWFVGALVIFANLGIDISALIAGMGIGGIAVALAAQNILEDVFCSFSIYFDKPYKVGDFILFGDDLGAVEKIGIKTTRIKTLRGEELVVSNKEMTSTRIHNFGRMPHRRIDFGFGVTYDTPVKKLKKIPDMVKKIVEEQELVRFDRAHFKEFGDSSLNYEVVYYLDSPDYNKYMDTQQAINLQIAEAFEKEKIVFAFPSRTVYMAK